MKTQTPFLLAAAGGAAFLLLAGPAMAQGGPPTVDAHIINDVLNPVPVTVQGSGFGEASIPVTVAPGEEPLPVEVQGPLVIQPPAVTPVLRKVVKEVDCEESSCPGNDGAVIYTVPAGKNLYIDYVTLLDRTLATAPGVGASQLYLRILNFNPEGGERLEGLHFIGNIGTETTFQDGVTRSKLGRNVPIAVGPGGRVDALVTWFNKPFAGNLRWEVVLSGRLEDAE